MTATNNPPQRFSVSVPATCANMGPGFDSFGMALDWRNHFSIETGEAITLDAIVCAETALAGDTSKNLVFQAMNNLFQKAGKTRPPIELTIKANLPLARGLGSSSTAIIAGLSIANRLSGGLYGSTELGQIASTIEGHPDNVIPALLGGIQLCDGDRHYALPWPESWGIILVIPPYPILTEDARQVLPQHPSRAEAIFNLRKASLLTYALLKSDPDAFADSLSDTLHQPYRGQMIPEFEAVSSIAQSAGALGTIISGSGSTLCVFYPSSQKTTVLNALNTWAAHYQHPTGKTLIKPVAISQKGPVFSGP